MVVNSHHSAWFSAKWCFFWVLPVCCYLRHFVHMTTGVKQSWADIHSTTTPFPKSSYFFPNDLDAMINVPWQQKAVCLRLGLVQCSITPRNRNQSNWKCLIVSNCSILIWDLIIHCVLVWSCSAFLIHIWFSGPLNFSLSPPSSVLLDVMDTTYDGLIHWVAAFASIILVANGISWWNPSRWQRPRIYMDKWWIWSAEIVIA